MKKRRSEDTLFFCVPSMKGGAGEKSNRDDEGIPEVDGDFSRNGLHISWTLRYVVEMRA